MMRHQLSYPFLAGFLKSVYVEAAEHDFADPGAKQTDSRIHILTGVHRKDVRRLRHGPDEEEDAVPPKSISVGAQLVARWTADARYLDAFGKPAPLPLSAPRGRPSFEDLVNRISRQDIRSAAVRDELLRLGVCHMDERERMVLNQAAFVPDRGFDEKAFYFGQNVRDHIAAAAHNLAGGQPALFDRSVYYDRLSPASVDALSRLAGELAMDALQSVNRKALALQVADRKRSGATARINFGAFVYREQVATPKDDDHA